MKPDEGVEVFLAVPLGGEVECKGAVAFSAVAVVHRVATNLGRQIGQQDGGKVGSGFGLGLGGMEFTERLGQKRFGADLEGIKAVEVPLLQKHLERGNDLGKGAVWCKDAIKVVAGTCAEEQ